MSGVDTSREAVEQMAEAQEADARRSAPGMPGFTFRMETAETLRALLDERDAAYAAGWRAGAEAMRKAARDEGYRHDYCPCGGPPCQTPPGYGCGVQTTISDAIAALPLPEPP